MRMFPSIRIEGGLLGPDVLDQLVMAELPGQRAADFDLSPRRSVTDEMAAVFSDAQTLWTVFQHRLDRLEQGDFATSLTRDSWILPFLSLLGYSPRYNQKAYEQDDRTFAISHRAGESEDAPPVHAVGFRQELGKLPPSGRPRLAPHSLVQEYLNRSEHLWGIVTNGHTLRLLRDSTLIRRQAYIEFDLVGILEEQRFQDFSVLYRLLHRSRLPHELADANSCLLEQYYQHSVEQGGRVRGHLREGVEECIKQLAHGFLRHPQSEELVKRLRPETQEGRRISADEVYRQLLRLIYRMLFLLVSEDRGLISSNPIYLNHYGVGRIRSLLDRPEAFTDHSDIWQSLRVLWRTLANEQLASLLDLATLNGDLFAQQDLDQCAITNRELLEAFWHLAWYQEKGQPARRVNYAALDVEELGSVYESLLEFHPTIDFDSLGRATFDLIKGSGRKETGSYYTPPELVNELVHSALDPVIEDRLLARPDDPEKALLSIRVCDPACGSGHFLLAAARRLGKRLAQVRGGDEEPAPENVREAVRETIAHCIYGVDKNPLAVDLCRVALWLEAHTGDKPLTFLDHRIRCGDSLVGVLDIDSLKVGIPDKAFRTLEGDDKTAAKHALQQNRKERSGSRGLFGGDERKALASIVRGSHEIDELADDTPASLREKKRRFEALHADPEWLRQEEACNLWTAAFFQRLILEQEPITSADVIDRLAGTQADTRRVGRAEALAMRNRFFHWPVEFPEVFAEGGFDVVLSNPPWERIKLQEKEFFAVHDARIANAANKAARTRLIKALPESNPVLYEAYIEALRAASAASSILRDGGRYPLTGRGDINTYTVFAEHARAIIREGGRAGIIVPTGIATDDTTKYFFGDLVQSGSLASLYDFENRKGIFPAVHKQYKFSLVTLTHVDTEQKKPTEFIFFALGVEDLRDPDKRFSLTADEIALLNPNTGNCPIFRTQADAELTKAIYRRVPVLWREQTEGRPEENPWGLSFKTMFHMANDSHHFRTADELRGEGYTLEGNVFASRFDRYLPLYEAKMLHQFDHRWATYEDSEKSRDVTLEEKKDPNFVVQPRYWVREDIVNSAMPGAENGLPPSWFMGWRNITNTTNERTLIASAAAYSAVGHAFLLMLTSGTPTRMDSVLLATLNSLVQDYSARQKVGGTNFTYGIMRQLPVPPSEHYAHTVPWCSATWAEWILSRILELVYTAQDLEPLARVFGYSGSPFTWDEARRFEIRCELDAAFFHLYLPCTDSGDWKPADGETRTQLADLVRHFPKPRDAVEHILEQFPITKRKDEEAYGTYRTKDRILAIYDAMLEAQRTGQPYKTSLDPPPGERRGRET